jgi:anti-sigma factor ChrR (cupin superfamily)
MQNFISPKQQNFQNIDFLPGSSWSVLATPFNNGSIHRLKMKAGSIIPSHEHPSDEYVLVLSGTFKTGDTICEAGTFIRTLAGTKQGPHEAITDLELLTIRMGALGTFDS